MPQFTPRMGQILPSLLMVPANNSTVSRWKAFLSAITVFVFFLSSVPVAEATRYYWAGHSTDQATANDDRWEKADNWSTTRNGSGDGAIPGASDIAIFDSGTGTKVVRVRSSVNVAGIELNKLWTGSVLVGTGVIKVGTSNFKIGSGYFVMGNQKLDIAGSYTQTGGVMRGLMNTMSISGSLSITNGGSPISVFTSTGTIVFSGGAAQTYTPSQTARIENITLRNYAQDGTNTVTVATNNMTLSGALTIARGRLMLNTNSKTLTVGRGITLTSHASGGLVTDSNVTNSGGLTVGTLASLAPTGGTWKFNSNMNQTVDMGPGHLWNVTIDNPNKSGDNKVIASAPFSVSGALTITKGKLDMTTNSKVLNVYRGITLTSHASGALVTNSNVFSSGSVTIGALTTLTVSGGTWKDQSQTNATLTFNSKPLQALTIANGGVANSNTTTMGSQLNASGAIAITSGNFDTNNYLLNSTGNITTSASTTLNARAGSIKLAGSWTNKGSFVSDGSTVTLNGTSQTLSGSTVFHTLVKNVSASDTLTFSATSLFSTRTKLDLRGASSNRLSLRSTISGVPFKLLPENTRTVAYLDVKDSNNTYVEIRCGTDCNDSGGNTNWNFAATSTDSSTTTATTTGGGSGGGGGGRSRTTSTSTTPTVSTPALREVPAAKVTKPKVTAPKSSVAELRKKKVAERKARAAERKARRMKARK